MNTNMLFPAGKKKALTFSYDDGTIYDRKLVALMNEYGMKCTFNLNAGLFSDKHIGNVDGKEIDFFRIDAEEVKDLYVGHEVASHTYTHPSLTETEEGAAREEVLKDRARLEELTGYPVKGFAYPYGTFNGEVEALLMDCGIVYGRTVCSTENFGLPEKFIEWHPTCHHDNPKMMELAERFCQEDDGAGKLFYVWGHSYEFHRYENWAHIEGFMRYMQEHKEDIWMATNMEIMDYITAYKGLVWSEDEKTVNNPGKADVWFEADAKVYCVRSGETVAIA